MLTLERTVPILCEYRLLYTLARNPTQKQTKDTLIGLSKYLSDVLLAGR